MAKLLAYASLLVQLASAVLLSLGVLTPEIVRALGSRLEEFVLAKPKSLFFRWAHARVIGSNFPARKSSTDLKDFLAGLTAHFISRCSIELSVFIITAVFAELLSLLLLLALSTWGLLRVTLGVTVNPLPAVLPVVGLLVSACGVCKIFEPDRESDQPGNVFAKLRNTVFRLASWGWSLASPVRWLMFRIVRFFTMAVPLVWYRSLKTIHARGLNWAFTLLGLLLFVLSLGLQLCTLIMAA